MGVGMGFKFSYLCDLLSSLDRNRHLKASSAARVQNPDLHIVSNWFLNHSRRIHDKDTDLLALLSCLFPEKRPDRVYWLQHASLARVIARCLFLGTSRTKELDRWRSSGGGDLGHCVENVMSQAENQVTPGQEVTVEEIDSALNEIAARCRFSGPRVRRQHAAVDVDETLGALYRRLSSRDAKWLTRIILKSYYPVILPINTVLKNIHFLLPHLLFFQDSFEAAVTLLKTSSLRLFPPRPTPDVAKILNEKALEHLAPRVGIKISRPDFYKARSIKHCCKMVGRRRISLERKYDGEYCQIHVDVSKSSGCIQIFSKSGKDSTADRVGIHEVIKKSLRIGQPDCKVSRRCILEGELLVWSDKDDKILEFHKLRKFLTRSDTFLGTDYDSQPKPYEHLMIMFFDILLLDDNICLGQPHRKRRLLLKDTIKVTPGRAEIAEQEIVDFSRPDAPRQLQRAFARSITERWEGYVLKACEEPYFAILSSDKDDGFCRWIKLKKDYIPGLGDTADFALIGARYDAKDAQSLKHIHKLCWTHFFLGCLENKDAISQFGTVPRFRVVDMIGLHSLNAKDMQVLNQWGKFHECKVDSNSAFEVRSVHSDLPGMQVAFKVPFVVEVLGSGFDKPSNAQYFTLRFPRVLKLHWDRTYEDTISFSELQQLAEEARSVPADEMPDEDALWCERIEAANGKSEYIVDRSQSSSETSPKSTLSTLSPQDRRVTFMTNAPPPLSVASNSQEPDSRGDICTAQQTSELLSSTTRRVHKRRSSSSLPTSISSRLCKRSTFLTTQPDIPIFADASSTASPPRQDPREQHRYLKNLENMSSQSAATAPVSSKAGHRETTFREEDINNLSSAHRSPPLQDPGDKIQDHTSLENMESQTPVTPPSRSKAVDIETAFLDEDGNNLPSVVRSSPLQYLEDKLKVLGNMSQVLSTPASGSKAGDHVPAFQGEETDSLPSVLHSSSPQYPEDKSPDLTFLETMVSQSPLTPFSGSKAGQLESSPRDAGTESSPSVLNSSPVPRLVIQDTETGHELEVDIARSPAPPRYIELETPIMTVPMYCGDFFFRNGNHEQLEHLFRTKCRSYSFSLDHFVESLGFPYNRERLCHSNPSAVENDIALGIALVGPRDGASKLAREIFDIASAVANIITFGHPPLPSKGKIFLLSYQVLTMNDSVEDRKWLTPDYWAAAGEHHFCACVSWGYGLPEDNAETRRAPMQGVFGSGYINTSLDYTDVVILWDAEELRVMGEFTSMGPLVHVSGQRFQNVGLFL